MSEKLNNEIWKSVVGYEGSYEVSNLGRVRSIRRRVRCDLSRVGLRIAPQYILKPANSIWGYPFVTLSTNNIKKPKSVHRLVAKAFLVNDNPERTVINHIDGNKENNNVSNLEWATYSENNLHAHRTGLAGIGEDRVNAKLTNISVLKIREMASACTQRQLAKLFGVSQRSIQNVIHRTSWNHI